MNKSQNYIVFLTFYNHKMQPLWAFLHSEKMADFPTI